MYRKILVPLEGSIFSEHALPLALRIAQRTGAELELLLVHSPMEAVYPEQQFLREDAWTTECKTRQRAYLDEVADRLHRAASVTVSSFVHEGDVAASIHQHVSDHKSDLVVMTTHARGVMARMWLGSVADQLVREFSRLLLLVHPGDQQVDLTKETIIKQVLIPLDGTPLAEQILEPAVALGEALDAEFALLRITRPVAPPHYPLEGLQASSLPGSFLEQIERTQTESRRKAEDYLDQVVQGLRARLLRISSKVVDESQPAVGILEWAQKHPTGLIAMQTHGRRGLTRLMLGSVADKVLRGSMVPLLLQRPSA
jgi:nucleotide-binding universal stress UspA family protein